MATVFQTIRTCDECTRIIGDDEVYFSVERCSQQDTGFNLQGYGNEGCRAPKLKLPAQPQ